MLLFTYPVWLREIIEKYPSEEDQILFDEINTNLKNIISKRPEVSIVIPAFNEEKNILKCIASFAKMKPKVPIEIIVVNNNSTDHTQKILDKLLIKTIIETKIGTGNARESGQSMALGRYILSADADCIYPPEWVDAMYDKLIQKGVTCVYSRHSFISYSNSIPRWQLCLYEICKDIAVEIRNVNRPHFNCFGMGMGYPRELGMKIGYDTRVIELEDGTKTFVRGQDGRMCYELSAFGKVKLIRSPKARYWTFERALNRDGNIRKSFFNKMKKEIKRLSIYFYPHPAHNTKQTLN